MTNIINKKECGYSYVSLIGKKFYAMRLKKLKSDILDIENITIVKDNTKIESDYSRKDSTRTILGGLFFGIPGAVIGHCMAEPVKWDVLATIKTKDKKVIQLHTSDEKIIRGLMYYVEGGV